MPVKQLPVPQRRGFLVAGLALGGTAVAPRLVSSAITRRSIASSIPNHARNGFSGVTGGNVEEPCFAHPTRNCGIVSRAVPAPAA